MSSIQIEQNGRIRTVPLSADETLLSVLRRAGYSIPAAIGAKLPKGALLVGPAAARLPAGAHGLCRRR